MRVLDSEIELSLDQATVIARAMLDVAASDGVHERERALIDDFYAGCAADAGAKGADLAEGSFDLDDARGLLSSDGSRLALVQSCYMLALADGAISGQEEARIAEISDALGVSQEARQRCAREAKLFFMQQFRGVTVFRDRAEALGRELGLEDEAIAEILNHS